LKRTLPVALLLVSLAACEEPPLKEIDSAEAALNRAKEGGADRFAADRFKEAQAALATAKEKLESKDYRSALSAAADAGEKSNAALQAAEAARTLAKSAAETALVEAEAAFDDVKAVKDEAIQDRVPDKAFQGLEPSLAEAHEATKSIAQAIEAGEFAQARQAGEDLKVRTADLADRYRRALEEWQQSHGRRRSSQGPPRRP